MAGRGVGAAARWGMPGVAAVAWIATQVGWIDWPAIGVWLARSAASLGWAALTMLLAVWAVWRTAPRRLAWLIPSWARRQPGRDDSPAARPS